MVVKFFLKVFSLSFFLVSCFWLFQGAAYEFGYARGQGIQESQLTLPKPAALQALAKDTTFLLLGMSGKPYAAPYLTDTIIVGQFKVNPAQVRLTSIPRDLMVQVPGSKTLAKINSLYAAGMKQQPDLPVGLIKKKVEEISGLTIDYYAIIDVAGLEKVIDAFGGIDVELDKPINDPSYPGPNYSYEPLYLAAGKHHLNGHDAVRFARSRHSTRGDFDRIARQQQLLNNLKEKIINQRPPLETFLELYKDLDGHVFSNITASDIPVLLATLLEVQSAPLVSHTLDNAGQGLLRSDKAASGAYILLPRAGLEQYDAVKQFFAGSSSQL